MGFRIVDEQPQHHANVEALLRAAFGGDVEAHLVNDLRHEGYVACALVAEDDGGRVIGHIVLSRLTAEIGGGSVAAVALAPLAVRDDSRRAGVGAALVDAGLARCRDQGSALAVVLGDARYYSRFGFSAGKARGLICPYAGPHLQVCELQAGALGCGEGRLTYAPPFNRVA